MFPPRESVETVMTSIQEAGTRSSLHTGSGRGSEDLDSPRPSTVPSAKRKKYTSSACDECKRRKSKCDGQKPCRPCMRNPSACQYTRKSSVRAIRPESNPEVSLQPDAPLVRPDGWATMNEKIVDLQQQINVLASRLSAGVVPTQVERDPALLFEQRNDQTGPSQNNEARNCHMRRKRRPARHPQYIGPTSSAFSLDVAKTSLQNLGIESASDPADVPSGSYDTTPAQSPIPSDEVLYARDPLLALQRSEVIRLIDIYEEESGTFNPFVDIKAVLISAEKFYDNTDPNRGSSPIRGQSDDNMLLGGVVDILKLVVAIALVIEGNGPTSLSLKLLDSVEAGFDGRPCGSTVDILEIQAWTLMSILQFHCDEEVLSWRTIGLAARAAVELGLHRREIYSAKSLDNEQRMWANRLFWCIYVLDRRWSFGTGLPLALRAEDIDPELPEPNNSNVLKHAIAYGHLGSKVWNATSTSAGAVTRDKTAYLEFLVHDWQRNIPPELTLHPTCANLLEGDNRTIKLRLLFHLSANQMRLLIFRQTLLTSRTITSDLSGARHVVNIAKDTIQVLHKLDSQSSIYASQQTCLNYFLVSALTVLFLAICHAAARFNEACREEFYLALDLVRSYSARSHVARRLWRTIKHLRAVGPKLGIHPNRAPQQRLSTGYHSDISHVSQSALITEHDTNITAFGLGSEYLTSFPQDPDHTSALSYPIDSNQLSNELTNMFEAIESDHAPEATWRDTGYHREYGFHNFGSEDLSRSLLGLL